MKNKVFVPGVFDFLHKGHTNLIEYAIDNYDEVYIGLINDKGLKLKNKKTYFSFQQRRNFIKNEFQNVKIIKTDSTKEHYEKILSSNNIKNILFGLDHKGSEKSEYLSKNFNVEIIERTKNISSTGLRNEISELNKKQLKVLQRALSIQRIILKDFKLINEEFTSNGINWFPHGGTLLGAHRNDSFIPWDDDIDMWMSLYELDKNYEKMIDIFSKYNYKMFSRLGDHTNRKTIGIKIIKNEIKKIGRFKKYRPFIDIMITQPYESLTNEEFSFVRNKVKEYSINYRNPFYIKKNKNNEILNSVLDKLDYKKSSNDEYRFIDWKAEIDYAWNISDTLEIEFEKIKLKAPKNYEEFLSLFYKGTHTQIPNVPEKLQHIGKEEIIKTKFFKNEYESDFKKFFESKE